MMFKTTHILYASASGNTKFVAEQIYKNIQNILPTQIDRVDNPSLTLEFSPNILYIFATSTWEHGEINPYFKPILKLIDETDMSQYRAVFVGTGDLRYEPVLFCGGMEHLRKSFKDAGGTEIASPLRIDGEPRQYKNTIIKDWINNLTKILSPNSE